MSSFDGYNSNGLRGVSDSGGVGEVGGWGVAIKQEASQQQPIMPSPAYSRGPTRGASASIFIPKSDLGTVRFRRKTTLLNRNLIKIERDDITIQMRQMEATIESLYINGERHIQQMQAANHMHYLQGAIKLRPMQASSQAFPLQQQMQAWLIT